MTDSFTFHLNSPLTEDDWNKIRDVELEHTERIWYSTPSGRRVDFINANVLDKIKEEIIKEADWWFQNGSNLRGQALSGVLLIIDKYKAKGGD